MAQRVRVLLIDDIDGGEGDETVAFSLDGTSYEIDLSERNAKRLRQQLEPFVASARKARKPTGRVTRGSRPVSSRERSAEIREWAKTNGIKVNERGRIPARVIEQYQAAN